LWTPCHHRFERQAISFELVTRGLDIFHSPDFIPPAFGVKKRVITVHDLNFIFYPQFQTAESMRYYAGQIQWAVDIADHISADSHATRQDVIELLRVPPDKISTIHLAANPIFETPYSDEVIEATLTSYNLPRGFILFVGTLEPRKNLPTLIRIYEKLKRETAVDCPLILIGSKGWIFDEIFATIDHLGLRDHVKHLSGVGDEQLAHLYHAAGVLVTPSHYEGFGLPALEAMHCGCPVIVSDRGSLPEVVGKAGILLPPDDVDGWASRISRVLADTSLREKMIVDGFAQAKKFTWRKTAEATLRIYQSLG